MKKLSFLKSMIIMVVAFILISAYTVSNAASKIQPRDLEKIDTNTLEGIIKSETSIDVKSLDLPQVLTAYQELTKKYTNKELADMIEEHKDEIVKKGVSETTISAGTGLLRTVDEKELTKILKEDLNLEEIQDKVEKGYSTKEIVNEIQNNMSFQEKVGLLWKVALTSSLVKTVATVLVILFIYVTIIKWVLFRKANRHGFATLIPIYRQVTELNVCQMSPWWLLLFFIPILGWIGLIVVWIVSKFKLAKAFERGVGFAFGLLFLGFIFESILAFNPNIKYNEIEE